MFKPQATGLRSAFSDAIAAADTAVEVSNGFAFNNGARLHLAAFYTSPATIAFQCVDNGKIVGGEEVGPAG